MAVAPDVLVVCINYWSRDDDDPNGPDDFSDRFGSIARVRAALPETRVIWLGTPLMRASGILNKTFAVKNDNLRRHFAQLRRDGGGGAESRADRAKDSSANGSPLFVGFDRMIEPSGSPWPRRDHAHFMCTHKSRIYTPIDGDILTPPTGDCHDMTNLNLLQVILNAIVFMDS